MMNFPLSSILIASFTLKYLIYVWFILDQWIKYFFFLFCYKHVGGEMSIFLFLNSIYIALWLENLSDNLFMLILWDLLKLPL